MIDNIKRQKRIELKATEINYTKYPYPHNPGVYIMKDDKENIIYIGKAKDLDKRIKSYFSKKIQNTQYS